MNSINGLEIEGYQLVHILLIAFGSIAIFGLVLVITTFILYQKIHKFEIEQIAYLSFSTLLSILGYIIFWIKDGNGKVEKEYYNICIAQAFLIVVSEMSQYFWSTLIIFNLYDGLVNFENNSKVKSKSNCIKRCVHIFIGFIIPIIIGIVAYLLDKMYGSGLWCSITIKSSIESNYFTIILFSILWLCIFANLFLLCKVKSFFKFLLMKDEMKTIYKDLKKLMCYPIIQMICVIPDSLAKIAMWLNPETAHYFSIISQILTAVFAILLGYSIVIIFGAVSNVFELIKKIFCCQREQKINEIKSSFLSSLEGESKGEQDEINSMGMIV